MYGHRLKFQGTGSVAGKYRQTRVRRRCLGRVFYDLMHRYVEPGVETRLHDFTRHRSRNVTALNQ